MRSMIHADRITSSLSTEEGFLTPKPPFDFAKSLDFLGAFTPMRDDHQIEEQSLTRAVAVGGQTVVFKIRSTGLIKNPRLKRSEEHTSELQSHHDLVCRLLLEKKKYYHYSP